MSRAREHLPATPSFKDLHKCLNFLLVITPALLPRLRTLFVTMDADVALALNDLGLTEYRTRYSAVIRLVDRDGPVTIGSVATELDVTPSAASQTVSEMERRGYLRLRPAADGRQRLVTLTARSRRALPAIHAEWDATEAAAAALEAELPYPLSRLVDELAEALARTRFRDRIAAAAGGLPADVPADIRDALARSRG